MERLSPLFECEENSSDYCSSLSTTESDGFKEVITKVFELDIRNGERIKLPKVRRNTQLTSQTKKADLLPQVINVERVRLEERAYRPTEWKLDAEPRTFVNKRDVHIVYRRKSSSAVPPQVLRRRSQRRRFSVPGNQRYRKAGKELKTAVEGSWKVKLFKRRVILLESQGH